MTQENLSNAIKIKNFDSFEEKVLLFPQNHFSTAFSIVKAGFEEISSIPSISIFEEISAFLLFPQEWKFPPKWQRILILEKISKFPKLWHISCNHCVEHFPQSFLKYNVLSNVHKASEI